MSLSEYIRAICALKNQKATLAKLGKRTDSAEADEGDDKDAGELFKMQFWKIPTYQQDWKDSLSIKLSEEEGSFLKGQIIAAFPDSMMAFILRNGLVEVLKSKTFQEIKSLLSLFPEHIQQDYALAYSFSEYLFVLRTVYNIIVSDGRNEEANTLWEAQKDELSTLAEVELESVFSRLDVFGNVFLCNFLRRSQALMKNGDLDGLKMEIKRRERELKQTRAKTMHPGEFDPNAWFGGGQLDYRFGNAKVILNDIFESEGQHA